MLLNPFLHHLSNYTLPQLKTQQVTNQVIPPAKDSTVYEVMNFRVSGYDCTLVEHFAQYAHNLAKNMELHIFDK